MIKFAACTNLTTNNQLYTLIQYVRQKFLLHHQKIAHVNHIQWCQWCLFFGFCRKFQRYDPLGLKNAFLKVEIRAKSKGDTLTRFKGLQTKIFSQ